MNKKGSLLLIYIVIGLLVIITLFAIVEVFKENLDANRGGGTLNCPGVSDFNATAYSNQTSFEKLVYRPTCFVTGVSLSYFVLAVIGALFIWIYKSWRKP